MEVMVAMAVVAIAITVLIELFAGSLRLAGKSQEYSRAVFYGRQLLEEICLREDIAERSEEGVFEGDFTWRYEITPDTVLVEEEDLQSNFAVIVYNIRVTVLWPSGATKKSLTFETLKTVIETEESDRIGQSRMP